MTRTRLTILRRGAVLRAATVAFEVADGLTAGLGWGLALCAGAAAANADHVPVVAANCRRAGNVIYLPARVQS